jgi:hypothetical protein
MLAAPTLPPLLYLIQRGSTPPLSSGTTPTLLPPAPPYARYLRRLALGLYVRLYVVNSALCTTAHSISRWICLQPWNTVAYVDLVPNPPVFTSTAGCTSLPIPRLWQALPSLQPFGARSQVVVRPTLPDSYAPAPGPLSPCSAGPTDHADTPSTSDRLPHPIHRTLRR